MLYDKTRNDFNILIDILISFIICHIVKCHSKQSMNLGYTRTIFQPTVETFPANRAWLTRGNKGQKWRGKTPLEVRGPRRSLRIGLESVNPLVFVFHIDINYAHRALTIIILLTLHSDLCHSTLLYPLPLITGSSSPFPSPFHFCVFSISLLFVVGLLLLVLPPPSASCLCISFIWFLFILSLIFDSLLVLSLSASRVMHFVFYIIVQYFGWSLIHCHLFLYSLRELCVSFFILLFTLWLILIHC